MCSSFVLAMIGLLSCSTFSSPTQSSATSRSLNVVSIVNDYLPPGSDESFAHLAEGARDFSKAIIAARIATDHSSAVLGGLKTHEDLIRAITRDDSAKTLTVVYLASHGSETGFVLGDPLSFEEFFKELESRTKGRILFFVDSCFAGVFAQVLAAHRSERLFAITGTKGATLERWYSKTGSFSSALAETIRARYSPGRDGKLTLGQLYDAIAADIGAWNARYVHSSGPITEPGFYGPRDLVVFDFDARSPV
jgi:hypothetical protein